jgi:hypothetical protein
LYCNRLRGVPREVASGGRSGRVRPGGPPTETLSAHRSTTRERWPSREFVPTTVLPKNFRARPGRAAVSSPHRSRGILRQESIPQARSRRKNAVMSIRRSQPSQPRRSMPQDRDQTEDVGLGSPTYAGISLARSSH